MNVPNPLPAIHGLLAAAAGPGIDPGYPQISLTLLAAISACSIPSIGPRRQMIHSQPRPLPGNAGRARQMMPGVEQCRLRS